MVKVYQNKSLKRNRSKMKTKDCVVEWDLKSITKDASGSLFIEGFANTSDKDRVKDVILPKAFKETLPEFLENPVLLFQHDWDIIIGRVVEAKIIEDGETSGLWVKAKISNAKDVDDVRTKIKEGILTTFSIGYNELESNFDQATDTNFVSKIELLEISCVTIPCNSKAVFKVSEGQNGEKEVSEGLLKFISDSLNQLDGTEPITPDFLGQLVELYKPI